MAYYQGPYSALPQSNNRASTGFYDRFQPWQHPREETSRFYAPNVPLSADGYGKPAPILPPPVSARPPTYEQAVANDSGYQHTEQHTQSKSEKPVGGVSAVLDYNMDTMADFVAEMASGMYALFCSHICIADIDLMRSVQSRPNYHQQPDAAWRTWVHQVLCATRLPSATILLSLQYLSMRMQQIQGHISEHPKYGRQRMLTVALILGSKFLDDNTFINRSWAEVSGIDVKVLNYVELEWFQAMDHRLHREPSEAQGFNSWLDHWKSFELAANQRKANSLKLSPIDTSVQYQKTVHSAFPLGQSKQAFTPRLPTPEDQMRRYYGQFDNSWLYPHSRDASPVSAPHTGPTTPEYYPSVGANHSTWNAALGRRPMTGFPSAQAPLSQTQSHTAMSATLTAPIQEPSLQYLQFYNHQGGCRCVHCSYSPPRAYLPGYSTFQQPLSVAA
jgi:hypothetical protein